MLKEHVYFDNAATTWPKPESVYRFMDSFFRSHGVNPGRSGSLLAAEAEQMITSTRKMLAQFFGFTGPANRVVFTQNGTDALNTAIHGLLQPGDHMIITRLDHNAVLRTANHLERDSQIQVSRVQVQSDGYIDPSDIKAMIRPNTRLMVLNHASNVIGTVQPLNEVAAIAAESGVLLVVDSAQTAGVIPIDMEQSGIHVLTFPGHKGLFGPMGIGGLIVSESVDLQPQRFGGTGVDSISEYQPEDYPHRLEAGTVSIPGIAGLHAAQLWFRELGEKQAGNDDQRSHGELVALACEHIHRTEMSLLERIETQLSAFDSVQILARARRDARVATLSFVSEHLAAERIADQLDSDHHVCVRAGLQCAPLVHVDADTVTRGGSVRLSPGYFTDEQDMQQLCTALDDVLGQRVT